MCYHSTKQSCILTFGLIQILDPIKILGQITEDKYHLPPTVIEIVNEVKVNNSINSTGLPEGYEIVNTFSKDLITVKKGNKLGFLDYKKNIIIPPIYDIPKFLPNEKHFVEGRCVLSKNGLFGVLDKHNNEIIPFEFNEILGDSRGYFVKKNNKYGYFDIYGNHRLPTEYQIIDTYYTNFGYFIVKKNDKFGLVTKENTIVIPFKFDEIIYGNVFVEAPQLPTVRVKLDGKWGVYDFINNREVIKTIYDQIESLNDNFYKVKKDNFFGLFSFNKKILPAKFETIEDLAFGRLKVKKSGKFGIYNLDLKVFNIPPLFEKIEMNSYQFFTIYKNGMCSLWDLNGKKIISDEFNKIIIDEEFSLKLNLIKVQKSNVFGIYNYFGNQIVPVDNDEIFSLGSPYLLAKKDGKYAIYNSKYSDLNTGYIYNSVFKTNENEFLLDGKKYMFLKKEFVPK